MIPVRPSKIIGIGRNYAAHAREMGNEVPDVPILFFKPPSSLICEQRSESGLLDDHHRTRGVLGDAVGGRAEQVVAQAG